MALSILQGVLSCNSRLKSFVVVVILLLTTYLHHHPRQKRKNFLHPKHNHPAFCAGVLMILSLDQIWFSICLPFLDIHQGQHAVILIESGALKVPSLLICAIACNHKFKPYVNAVISLLVHLQKMYGILPVTLVDQQKSSWETQNLCFSRFLQVWDSVMRVLHVIL